jgi:putative spermidine/putrescine transport system substrate-binding protein
MASTTRKALTAGAILATVALLAGCAGGQPKAGDTTSDSPEADTSPVSLTFVAYGGSGQDAMIKAWQEPYTAEHPNVTFTNASPPDVAQVKAQVTAGNVQWDVLATAAYAATQNCGTLFEKLDLKSVDTKDLIKGAVGPCYVGNFANSTPLAYRTDAFPDPATAPKTIEDFFDTKKFPGKRGVLTNLQNGIIEYGLLGDGVAPSKLYPLDVDRSLKKWSTIRDDTVFAPNVGVLQQAVSSKQVDMFLLSDSRLVTLMDSGMDITVVWDKTVTSLNAFAVPLGAPHKAAATDFLKSVVQPTQSAAISAALGVAPVNLTAKPDYSPNAAKLQVFNKKVNTGKTIQQDIPWWAKNFNAVTVKLTNWLAG